MEGIIGVADMKDVDANAELAYKEISIIISKLKSYNITHITVCNIHNDGSCLNSEKINLLGAELVQGVHNLVPIINQFSISFMIGFHCKRNGGGRFGHTFRNDIVKMSYGNREIGEVGAYYRWLILEKVPVVMISGEGDFQEEIKEYGCFTHVILKQLKTEKDINEEYLKLERIIQQVVNLIRQDNITVPLVPVEELFVKIDNSDKYCMLENNFKVCSNKNCFVFLSIKAFFKVLYRFATELNLSTEKIYMQNIKFISQVKRTNYTKQELTDMLYMYLKRDILEINYDDRRAIANIVGISYEDFLCYQKVL